MPILRWCLSNLVTAAKQWRQMKVCETQNSPFNWILAAFECLWICHFDSPQGGRRSEEPIDVILTNDSEKEMNQSKSDQPLMYFEFWKLGELNTWKIVQHLEYPLVYLRKLWSLIRLIEDCNKCIHDPQSSPNPRLPTKYRPTYKIKKLKLLDRWIHF